MFKKHVRKMVIVGVVGGAVLAGFAGVSPVSAASGPGHPNKQIELTAEQSSCMASSGVTRQRGPKTLEQKATVKAAAQACGVWMKFAKLSTVQRDCLRSAGLSRPSGLPSAAQKKQLRSAAAGCNVTLRIK